MFDHDGFKSFRPSAPLSLKIYYISIVLVFLALGQFIQLSNESYDMTGQLFLDPTEIKVVIQCISLHIQTDLVGKRRLQASGAALLIDSGESGVLEPT